MPMALNLVRGFRRIGWGPINPSQAPRKIALLALLLVCFIGFAAKGQEKVQANQQDSQQSVARKDIRPSPRYTGAHFYAWNSRLKFWGLDIIKRRPMSRLVRPAVLLLMPTISAGIAAHRNRVTLATRTRIRTVNAENPTSHRRWHHKHLGRRRSTHKVGFAFAG